MLYMGKQIFQTNIEKIVPSIQSTIQKRPSRGVDRKRCSENMQQIYRRTPMPKFNFNEFAKGTLLNSHSDMSVFLYICCIFPEHIFLGTPLDGCFWQYLTKILRLTTILPVSMLFASIWDSFLAQASVLLHFQYVEKERGGWLISVK